MELNADREILEILRVIMHDFGNLVAGLRNGLHTIKGDLQLGETSDREVERAYLIAEVTEDADEIAHWIQRIRFLLSEDDLIACDFIRDVLQPTVMWTWRKNPFRLAAEPSARNAPPILIRPRLATCGLLRLRDFLYPFTRCAGTLIENRFTFTIAAEHPLEFWYMERVKRGCELLKASGAEVELSPDEKQIRITLRVAEGPP